MMIEFKKEDEFSGRKHSQFNNIFKEANLTYLLKQTHILQNQCTVIVAATEAEAQEWEETFRNLLGTASEYNILYFPGFFQAGVFRFESAKKVITKRLNVLDKLLNSKHSTIKSSINNIEVKNVVITTINGMLKQAPNLTWLENKTLPLTPNSTYDLEILIDYLNDYGYSSVQKVEIVGEFCVRGSIVDLWVPGENHPSRLDFFGDSLENIRSFRVGDQRSFASKDSLRIIPCREFVWPNRAELEELQEKFNYLLLERGIAGRVRSDLLENVAQSVPFPGIDDIACEFLNLNMGSFFSVLLNFCQSKNQELKIYTMNSAKDLWQQILEIEKVYKNPGSGGLYVPGVLSKLYPELEEATANFQASNNKFISNYLLNCIPLNNEFLTPPEIHGMLNSPLANKFHYRANILHDLLQNNQVSKLVLLCRSSDSLLELHGILSKYIPELQNQLSDYSNINELNLLELFAGNFKGTKISQRVFAYKAKLDGFIWFATDNTLYISENWILGAAHLEASLDVYNSEENIPSSNEANIAYLSQQFGEFRENDLVVHVQHGIAKFKGLVTVQVMNATGDFLVLEYLGNDKIYVPVHKLNQVQKYIGNVKSDSVVLDSLKSAAWEQKKAKACVDAKKLAEELLTHQAKRLMTPGHVFGQIGEEYIEFESAFAYDETVDQLKAIKEIMVDMSKPKAMDRLLVGDVGFGKTEVAMRAAYRAVLDGMQVAWLVPTTVLAHQHFRSLKERYAEFGVNVGLLDRSASSKKVLANIEKGLIDICVGTHRLLSSDVKFNSLGLLVVDEEQRFGVIQKDKIKNMSYGIDVLTLTATPIPRTLQMAMLGIRDLSLLATPPKARLAIKTFICQFEEKTIAEAINFEINRGGQIFYVHNKVEDLESMAQFLLKLVPNLKICIGHGKMPQLKLDATIIDFIEQKYDLLLCTTIIESGIDMPNVNTILVQDAVNFGLSQLYQLRGRVGRRSTRGYAYFLVSEDIDEKSEGMQRLEILREHQELGSGFVIASHDLEIRGGGSILGDDQSGKVSEVGLETYSQMLDDAIKTLGGIKVRTEVEAEINVPFTGQIPPDYVENSQERLKLYRRFFGARNEEALQNLLGECEDRFGEIPVAVKLLAEMSRLRRWLIIIGAISLTIGEDYTEIKFSPDILQSSADEMTEVLIKRILDLCNRVVKGARLTTDGRLLLPLKRKQFNFSMDASFTELKRTLSMLAGEAYAS